MAKQKQAEKAVPAAMTPSSAPETKEKSMNVQLGDKSVTIDGKEWLYGGPVPDNEPEDVVSGDTVVSTIFVTVGKGKDKESTLHKAAQYTMPAPQLDVVSRWIGTLRQLPADATDSAKLAARRTTGTFEWFYNCLKNGVDMRTRQENRPQAAGSGEPFLFNIEGENIDLRNGARYVWDKDNTDETQGKGPVMQNGAPAKNRSKRWVLRAVIAAEQFGRGRAAIAAAMQAGAFTREEIDAEKNVD